MFLSSRCSVQWRRSKRNREERKETEGWEVSGQAKAAEGWDSREQISSRDQSSEPERLTEEAKAEVETKLEVCAGRQTVP